MRKTREIIRLSLGLGQSQRKTAESCGVGRTTVGECIIRAKAARLSWPLPADLDDQQLEALLYPKHRNSLVKAATPDWSKIHFELKRKGVTRQLLWQEYLEQHPNGLGYSHFCDRYRQWCRESRISMRQHHKAGEKLFVDFAGTTIPIHDPQTGKIKKAEIFVATWGASNFTYAEAVWSQDLPSWISCHVHAFEYFGCVPEIVVPDNLKSGVTKPCRYDPEVNETYADLARHYEFAVIPAHVRKPKHKAKVEFSVLLVTRWILAALRKRRFFSLEELNEAILKMLPNLNAKPFQKMPGSRQSAFMALDKPASNPLPASQYIFAETIKARVNVDYHVAIDNHFYSVPFQLRGKQIRARMTSSTIEILYKNRRIFTHRRSYKKWTYTTIPEHRPKEHRDYAEWSPERMIDWASKNGPNVAHLIEKIMMEKSHPEQGFRAGLGIIRLAERFGKERIDRACARALAFRVHRYGYVKSILERGLDRPDPQVEAIEPITHENIRGGEYYRNILEEKNAGQRDDCQDERHETFRHGQSL